MKNLENDTLLARWLSGELAEEEKKAFERSDDFPIYQKIVQSTDLYRAPDFDAEEMLTNIKAGKEEDSVNTSWFMRIAATVLILLASYFAFDYLSVVSYSSQYGEVKTISLPDGSKVTLNAASSLSHQRWGWSDSRKVSLSGEAYFEVAKGSTFTVGTDEGQVKVLGTIFDIKNSVGFLEVVCYEGRVQVNSAAVEKILTANMGFRRIEEVVSDLRISTKVPSWINAESTFDQIPAKYVFEELEKQYGIQIKGSITANQVFTGSFPNDNLDLALNIVLGTLDVRYQINNDVVELLSE